MNAAEEELHRGERSTTLVTQRGCVPFQECGGGGYTFLQRYTLYQQITGYVEALNDISYQVHGT